MTLNVKRHILQTITTTVPIIAALNSMILPIFFFLSTDLTVKECVIIIKLIEIQTENSKSC